MPSADTVAPGQVITLAQTYASDATSITLGIVNGAGSTVLPPTAYGIAHPAAGTYLYSWAVPAGQDAGTYTAVWNALFSGVPAMAFESFEVSAAGGARAWCALADVESYTGLATATQASLVAAQGMLEGLIKRVWRETDSATGDFYWLARAVAWQAVHVAAHPELLTMMDVQSISQDGLSITFKSSPTPVAQYNSTALKFCGALFQGANTSLRFNSAFQKNRSRRPCGEASVAWRPL